MSEHPNNLRVVATKPPAIRKDWQRRIAAARGFMLLQRPAFAAKLSGDVSWVTVKAWETSPDANPKNLRERLLEIADLSGMPAEFFFEETPQAVNPLSEDVKEVIADAIKAQVGQILDAVRRLEESVEPISLAVRDLEALRRNGEESPAAIQSQSPQRGKAPS